MSVRSRYRRVVAEVAEVCEQCGREPAEVRVIAVSKTVGPDEVAEAVAGGACDFGENRPDQLVSKAAAFPEARWHFIGNIQSRRIPDIVGSAALIHSLYQLRHGQKIDQAAERLGKVQDVLVEVNVSGEASKSGVAPEEAGARPHDHGAQGRPGRRPGQLRGAGGAGRRDTIYAGACGRRRLR